MIFRVKNNSSLKILNQPDTTRDVRAPRTNLFLVGFTQRVNAWIFPLESPRSFS